MAAEMWLVWPVSFCRRKQSKQALGTPSLLQRSGWSKCLLACALLWSRQQLLAVQLLCPHSGQVAVLHSNGGAFKQMIVCSRCLLGSLC